MDYQDRFDQQPTQQLDTTAQDNPAPVFTPVRPAPGLSVVRSLLLMLLVFVGTVDLLLLVFILHSLGFI